MPKSLKKKSESLLNYIEKDISWKDNGELMYRNQVLEGSHITDLIRYALQEYGRSPPIGFNHFIGILSDINVPKKYHYPKKKSFAKCKSKTLLANIKKSKIPYFKQMNSKLSKQGQIALIFLIIVVSLLNISLGTDTKNYWLTLMGTCLTYLVPIQKLKEYGRLEKSKIYYNPKEPASFAGPIKLYRKLLKDGRVKVTYDAI